MKNTNCLYCGFSENHPTHDRGNKDGWHLFCGLDYLLALEDALLFARENKQQHQWSDTGITIDTASQFEEKICVVCGAINWGGEEDGICFGKPEAEAAIVAAHNRRASRRLGNR